MSAELKKLESLYIKAKLAYYEGNPTMSDAEFDLLEERLKKMGSDKPGQIVGGGKSLKVKHISPMLSLDKISVYDENLSKFLDKFNTPDNDNPIEQFMSWVSKEEKGLLELECSPKLDGNAINLIYGYDSNVVAVTRGDGDIGFDCTKKFERIVPKKIDFSLFGTDLKKIEIRGEAVMSKSIFDIRWSKDNKNPRNMVAGIISRDEVSPLELEDIEFVAFEVKLHYKSSEIKSSSMLEVLKQAGFKTPYSIEAKLESRFRDNFFVVFNDFYTSMKEYRQICEYQLDGFVIKFKNSEVRSRLGETDHHPKWAIAVKFPPKESITKIKDIDWNVGTTGEIVPTAVLEPIELDGTTVSRATLFNHGFMKSFGAYPYAEVLVAKAGDIIPQIYKVVKSSEVLPFLPVRCPSCGSTTVFDDKHIWCTNYDECPDQLRGRIKYAIQILKFDRVGGAMVDKLFDIGFRNISDYFGENFSKQFLLENGFKDGRQLEILLDAVNAIKNLEYKDVILLLGVRGLGESAAKQIASYLNDDEYDFKGLTKDIVNEFTYDSDIRKRLYRLIEILESRGISVTYVKRQLLSNDTILFEMTGSPKDAGFKTKEEFLEFTKSKNLYHSKLDKNCKYLVTDSYSSLSGKMKTASKLGVEIITYEDLVKKLS